MATASLCGAGLLSGLSLKALSCGTRTRSSSQPLGLASSKSLSGTSLRGSSLVKSSKRNERSDRLMRISMVAAPFRTTAPSSEEERFSAEFDASAPPPFTLADIRAAIPKHCWEKNTWTSVSYLLRDVAVVFGLAAGAAYLNSWAVWPLYWFAQGTMFWALFVMGHDCGHGSFSNNKKLNDFIGHLTHSSILVPFHGWRISHRTHHANHGHVENDESWHPMAEDLYREGGFSTKFERLLLPFPLLAYPFYLWKRSPGKEGNHFDPSSDLFVPNERNDVLTSTACYFGMMALIVGLSLKTGPLLMLNLYGIPYWINVVWLAFVTYLHHHGYDEKVPWYRGEVHHDIGTHVVHHLFPQIPHYHLVEATAAIKPVLGDYYREPQRPRGLLPLHLIPPLIRSFREDHFVANEGDVVFYQKDPHF
eukprot:jgi/Mesen1/8080/ME000434S07330